MASNPKFDLKKINGESFMFNLTASNGRVILSSEPYTSKSGALHGIEAVRKNSSDGEHYEKKTSPKGKYFFTLMAGNNQVIGSSDMYESETGRDQDIGVVMVDGPKAEVEDNT